MCHDFAGNELIFQYLALNVQTSHQWEQIIILFYYMNSGMSGGWFDSKFVLNKDNLDVFPAKLRWRC